MKRRIEVTPQARRDIAAIITWYRENVGAGAALKVARTIRSRLTAMEAGRVKGAELVAGSRYLRVVAKRHVVVFLPGQDVIRIVRVVHGAQNQDAIAALLEREEE